MKTKIYEFDPVIYPFQLQVCKYVPGVTASEIAERYVQVVDRHTAQVFSTDDLLANPTLTAKTCCVLQKDTDEMKYLVILYRPKKIRWGTVSHEEDSLGNGVARISPRAHDARGLARLHTSEGSGRRASRLLPGVGGKLHREHHRRSSRDHERKTLNIR